MLYEILIAALIFVTVVTLGAALLMFRNARKNEVKSRLDQLTKDGRDASGSESESMVTSGLTQLGKMVSSDNKRQSNLRMELAAAGIHDKNAVWVYLGLKIILLLLGSAMAFIIAYKMNISLTTKILAIFSAGAILSFLPNIYVQMRRRKRTEIMRRNLPDTVDLLEVCVSAGMGLDIAWNIITEEISPMCAPLSDEMALTNLEIHLGSPKTDAMRHMAERTGIEELSSLSAVLVQTERFGTSVSDALKTFARSMREERSFKAEERAEKMAVKLLFPMVLFIFPVVIVVSAGPALIKIAGIMFSG